MPLYTKPNNIILPKHANRFNDRGERSMHLMFMGNIIVSAVFAWPLIDSDACRLWWHIKVNDECTYMCMGCLAQIKVARKTERKIPEKYPTLSSRTVFLVRVNLSTHNRRSDKRTTTIKNKQTLIAACHSVEKFSTKIRQKKEAFLLVC